MRACDFCKRPVVDDAAICPHPGCGKPLAGAGGASAARALKRPPPPGRVTAPIPIKDPAGIAPRQRGGGRSLRLALAIAAVALLLIFTVWGAFYAASPPDKEQFDLASGTGETGTRENSDSSSSQRTSEAERTGSKSATGGSAQDAGTEKSAGPEKSAEPEEENRTETPGPQVVTGIYYLRTEVNREKWIGELGGTEKSETAVQGGLEWLARHQAEDGHWGPDCLGAGPISRCEPQSKCDGPGQRYEMAQSGLALLAFQAGGHYYFNKKPYSEHVRRGLDWLVEHQGDDGALVGAPGTAGRLARKPARASQGFHQYYMYEHGMATLALVESCAVARAAKQDPDPRYLAAAVKALYFIEQQQHNDGGWRYHPIKSERSDTSVSGWQVLALKTAKEAEIGIGPACLAQVEKFFKSCEIGHTGRTGYQGSSQLTEATTGVGMLVHQFLLDRPDSPLVTQAAPYLAQHAEQMWGGQRRGGFGSTDYYLWYNCTLAMFRAGGEPWKRWNDVVRDTVLKLQVHQGCTRGSWPVQSDRWAGTGGRVYSTALAVLTLEVYYRYKSERAKVYEQPKRN